MFLLTKNFLYYFGTYINVNFYIGAIPFQWNFAGNHLSVPNKKVFLSLWYLSVILSFSFTSFCIIKSIWVYTSTRVTIIESINVCIPIYFFLMVCAMQGNLLFKLNDTVDLINKLIHFILHYQVEHQSQLKKRQNKFLEHFFIFFVILSINSNLSFCLVYLFVGDPRISLNSFISYTDFQNLTLNRWDLKPSSLNNLNWYHLLLNLYVCLYFFQIAGLVIIICIFLVLIGNTIPTILETLNHRNLGFPFFQRPINRFVNSYRCLQLMVYNICQTFGFLLPVFIASVIMFSIVLNFLTIHLNPFLQQIVAESSNNSNVNAGKASSLRFTFIQISFQCIFLGICMLNIMLLKFVSGNLAKCSTLSNDVLKSLKQLVTTKYNVHWVRSCRIIKIQVGSFGTICRHTYLILLGFVFDYTILLILTYSS